MFCLSHPWHKINRSEPHLAQLIVFFSISNLIVAIERPRIDSTILNISVSFCCYSVFLGLNSWLCFSKLMFFGWLFKMISNFSTNSSSWQYHYIIITVNRFHEFLKKWLKCVHICITILESANKFPLCHLNRRREHIFHAKK